jgi:hypothetical protein
LESWVVVVRRESVVERIRQLLESGVLCAELTRVPDRGATAEEIAETEERVGRALPDPLRHLLSIWNGIDIEILRICGCGNEGRGLATIETAQRFWPESPEGALVIGSDPAGFLYLELQDGRITSYDTDGGEVKTLAADFDDFICRLVLGPDAAEFAGEDWASDLKQAGFFLGRSQRDYERQLKAFGEVFAGRLNAEILQDALAYVDFGECTLALETLCDQLYEYDVWLGPEEYEALVELGEHLGAEMNRVTILEERVEYLDAAGDPFIDWPKSLPYAVLLPTLKLSPRQLLGLTKVLYFGSLNLLNLQKIFREAPRVLVADLPIYELVEVSEVLRREGILHEIIHDEMVKEPAVSQGMRWKPGSW